jgi:hypothetical protein
MMGLRRAKAKGVHLQLSPARFNCPLGPGGASQSLPGVIARLAILGSSIHTYLAACLAVSTGAVSA